MPRRAWPQDEGGVSPVIGTVLMLAITVAGIAGILIWGAPAIDRVQTQNAQVAVTGEFEALRDASFSLSVPDHSRFPTVSMPSGVLSLSTGTRLMVAANSDAANTGCDLKVTGWAGTAPSASVTVSNTGCRAITASTFEVFVVSGTTLSRRTISVSGSGPYTVTSTGADFTRGDWLFRITDGASNPVVYAEAWLHSGDRVEWGIQASTGARQAYLDSGAVFTRDRGTTFLAKAPSLGDSAFGSGYYGLWLRMLSATSLNSITQPGSHQVFLSLGSNVLHVDSNTTHRLRFAFAGDLSEGWCRGLLARNTGLADAGVAATYAEDGAASCAAGDAEGIRSVTFAYPASAAFRFRFLHASIHATLVL